MKGAVRYTKAVEMAMAEAAELARNETKGLVTLNCLRKAITSVAALKATSPHLLEPLDKQYGKVCQFCGVHTRRLRTHLRSCEEAKATIQVHVEGLEKLNPWLRRRSDGQENEGRRMGEGPK